MRAAAVCLVAVLAVACREQSPAGGRHTPPPAKLAKLEELRADLKAALAEEVALYARAAREKKTAGARRLRDWVTRAEARGREAAVLIRSLERLHDELRDGYGWEDPYASHFRKHSAALLERSSDALQRFVDAEGADFDPDADSPRDPGGPARSISLDPLPEAAADGRLGARREDLVRQFGLGFARVAVDVGPRQLVYRFEVMRDRTRTGPRPELRVVAYGVEFGEAIPFRGLARALREFRPALRKPVVICQSVEDRDAITVVVDEAVDLVQHVARIKVKADEVRELPPYGLGFVLELAKATPIEELQPDTEVWSVREVTSVPRPGHPAWKRLSQTRAFPKGLAPFFGG